MNIEHFYQIFLTHPTICTDSRNIAKNSIYFALKGENFDGNKFALEALEKGAQYAIVDEDKHEVNQQCILVNNVLEFLQKLANYHRKQLGIKIIAITGSNGKTTTKELIKAVLSSKYNVKATLGNLNNHIGVPLTLLSFDTSTQIGIVEMGANHIGEIEALCRIAEPNMGIITNIGKAHLEGFGSYEGVIKAKSELYNYIKASKGLLFINKDNKLLVDLIGSYSNTIGYGTSPEQTVSGFLEKSDPYLKIKVTCRNSSSYIESRIVGSYNIDNILAACSIGCYFDIQLPIICQSISDYKPENNRSQLQKTALNTLLLDFYNANPTSMKAAIENFSTIDTSGMPKVLILADMFELGVNADEEHKEIIRLLENNRFDIVFLAGTYFHKHNKNFISFETTDELVEHINNKNLTKNFILLKGSRGMKLEKCIPYL